jgi:DNA polymerase V
MPDHTNTELMQCLDTINHRYGNSTLKVAAQERQQLWQMRRNFLSPQYTSHWRDIPKIEC